MQEVLLKLDVLSIGHPSKGAENMHSSTAARGTESITKPGLLQLSPQPQHIPLLCLLKHSR